MTILARARQAVKDLQPYQSARSLGHHASIRVDANESPWPSEDVSTQGLNRYPEPIPAKLRARLAALYGTSPEQVLPTRGSDEAIELLVRTFCDVGVDRILCAVPTYGVYAVSAKTQGVAVDSASLDADFGLDVDAVLESVQPETKLVFLCSPNNPTGNLLKRDSIFKICQALRTRCVVVVDEAYLEYASTQSCASELGAHANLVVLRTLSKAWGLAGLRIGALLASADLVELTRRIQAPYPIPSICADEALRGVSEPAEARMRKRTVIVREQRERLSTSFSACQWVEHVYPSDANFILVRSFEDHIFEQFLAHDILLRDRSGVAALERCIRVTVGTPEENARIVEVAQSLGRSK